MSMRRYRSAEIQREINQKKEQTKQVIASRYIDSIKPDSYRNMEALIPKGQKQEVLLLLILEKLDEISMKLDSE